MIFMTYDIVLETTAAFYVTFKLSIITNSNVVFVQLSR